MIVSCLSALSLFMLWGFFTDTVKKRHGGQQQFLQKSFISLLILAVIIIAVLAGVIVWQYFQKSKPEEVIQCNLYPGNQRGTGYVPECC